MARALFDGLKDRYKAAQYLKFIKAKYPDFKEMSQVDKLLAECGA